MKTSKKQKLIKIIHIISYALSVCFLALMVGVSCYSCANRDNSKQATHMIYCKPVNMAFSGNDLTNTTWYFNQTLNLLDFYYDINFYITYNDYDYSYQGLACSISNGELTYVGASIGGGNQRIRLLPVDGVIDPTIVPYNSISYWDMEYQRTINIVGGVDVNNSNLINWLNNNATYHDTSTPSVSYTSINLVNTYNNQSMNVLINSDYGTFMQYYVNDSDTNVTITGNDYLVSWNGLGALYTTSAMTTQVTANIDIIEGTNFYYYRSDITNADLQEEYSEGYSAGSSEGYSNGYQEGYQNGYYEYQSEVDHINLSANYDFRQWVGSVDETSGCILHTINTDTGVQVLDYGGMTFRSNGNLYNTIRLYLIRVDWQNGFATAKDTATGQYLGFNGEYLFGNDCDKYCMLYYVDYLYKDSNDNVTLSNRVYSIPYVTNVNMTFKDRSNGATSTYVAKAYQCGDCIVDTPYRDIIIIENNHTNISTPAFTDTTLYTLLTMQLSQVSMAVFSGTGVFDLLRGAYDSIGGLLSIQILPNITIGLLIFLPLVATIIIAVLRVIKK